MVVGEWTIHYSKLLWGLQHLTLVLILLVAGFFLCSTLSNRYHHWEQAKVAQVAQSVAGDKLEQIVPQVRYVTQEPFTYTTQVDGKIVKVNDKREVNRLLSLAGSQVQVKLDQSTDVQNRSAVYRVDYSAEYKVVNRLNNIEKFFFEAQPPIGYSLLSNYKVERDRTRLEAVEPGNYSFAFQLPPGEEASFRVTYQAQGGHVGFITPPDSYFLTSV